MKRIPLIIDCDPGVDDAFAIALAHSLPDFDIVAITAVEGNVPATVTRRNALALADLFQIDCEVGFGADLPLEKPYLIDASGVHGTSGVGDVALPDASRKPSEKKAWDLIYDLAVKYNGELWLFACGPLTNIALCLKEHPDLPKYIKKFCIMGGGTFGNVTRFAEFNLFIDPLAAKEVIETLPTYIVGLDATHAGGLSSQEMDDLVALCSHHPFLRDLLKYSKYNSKVIGYDNDIIHDAIALASIIQEGLVTWYPAYVQVEGNHEKINNGQTILDFSSDHPNCYFAKDTNQPLFLEMMKTMCSYYNQQ